MVSLWLLWACAEVEPGDTAQVDLAPALTRASLDLRARRPTPEELEHIREDPDAFPVYVDRYLHDEGFGLRVQNLYARWSRTRAGNSPFNNSQVGLDPDRPWRASAGNEVPRIARRIAEEDLPYSEMVTGDWTMVDDLLVQTMNVAVEEDPGDTGWVLAHYDDDRPLAGMLSTSTLWIRYETTSANANRRRANQVMRMFLCSDLLERQIAFTPASLADEEAVSDALHSEASCLACHSSLDPLAAYFFGFTAYNLNDPDELLSYYPGRESYWARSLGTAPAYFGEAAEGSLDELGERLSTDPRFHQCAVETAQTLLLGREPAPAELPILQDALETYHASGETVRSLLRTVALDPRYQGLDPEDPDHVSVKLATPDIYASQVEQWTGYRWTLGGYEMLRSPTLGLRVAAGGVNGGTVNQLTTVPSVTMLLTHARFAELAAGHAVEQGSLAGIELFADDESARREVFAAVRREMFGPDVAEADVDVDEALWSDVLALESDEDDAWRAWATWMLSQPELLVY